MTTSSCTSTTSNNSNNSSTTTSKNKITPPQKFGDTLLTSLHGKNQSILLVALNRPKVKNAFNNKQYLDLIAILQKVANDTSIHAIVLTGMGDYFSSGADLSENNFGAAEDDEYDEENEKEDEINEQEKKRVGTIHKPPGQFMMTLLSFPKLICCAVNGPAVGIGVTLLPHCDIVFTVENATFWVPFTRIALVPEFASSVTFVEMMGLSCANEMLILGEKIDARKAVQNGLCVGIIEGCDCSSGGDAFVPNSIGRKVCDRIDEKLFSLPNSGNTAKVSEQNSKMIVCEQLNSEFYFYNNH